ncbi:MAG: hypothetical protein QXG25_00455 [Nitrososphaerota archaeon]
MTRCRWLGGIGYLLTFIPYANVVSWALTGLAWLLLGRSLRQGRFTVTGALMLVMFLIQAMAFPTLLPLLAPPTAQGPLASRAASPAAIAPLLSFLLAGGIAAIFLLIFEIMSHFRAAKLLNNRWFSIAGWLRIIAVIAALIALPLTLITALKALIAAGSATWSPSLELVISMFWPLILAISMAVASYISSAIAFIRLKI